MRPSKRKPNQLREISLETGISRYAEGSCLVKFGNTHVMCTASIDEKVPPFLRKQGKGWVTAEYSMLPRSTHSRMQRESQNGRPSGRTMEIQRLIGRSLRSVLNQKNLGERQIIVDCDVIQADGGTRTAAITGGYVALSLACKHLQKKGLIRNWPLIGQIAAISCGVQNGQALLDLDYDEDSNIDVDANFVMTADNKIVEIQSTAEENAFSKEEFAAMFDLAEAGIGELIKLQNEVLG